MCIACLICAKVFPEDDGREFCNDCIGFYLNSFYDPELLISYTCKKSNSCLQDPSAMDISCTKCRFKKCFEFGLKRVLTNSDTISSDPPPDPAAPLSPHNFELMKRFCSM